MSTRGLFASAEAPCPRLDAAYRATAYRVRPPLDLVLRVDVACPGLDRLLRARGAPGAAFIAAANPRGVPLSEADNQARDAELARVARGLGLDAHPGHGAADASDWPPEPSRLLLPLSFELAVVLARRFDQLALLFHRPGEVTRLCYTGLPPRRR